METKSIFTSKTFWINFLTVLVGTAAAINPDFLGVYKLPAATQNTILLITGLIAGVGNIVLRFISTQPVSITGSNGTSNTK